MIHHRKPKISGACWNLDMENLPAREFTDMSTETPWAIDVKLAEILPNFVPRAKDLENIAVHGAPIIHQM